MQRWQLAGGAVDAWEPLVSLEGVGSAYAAARDGIDALLRDRGLRRSGAGDDGRGAAARRPRQRRARGVGVDAAGVSRRQRRRDGRRLAAGVDRAAGAGAGARSLAAAGARPAARGGRRRRAARGPGRAADDARGRAAAASPGGGAAGLGGRRRRCSWRRSCMPSWRRPRRSPRTTDSSPAPPSDWCWSRAGSTRSRCSCRRRAHLALRPAYESNLRGYRDGGGAGRPGVAALRRGGLRRGRRRRARWPSDPPGSVGSGHASGTRSRGADAAADTRSVATKRATVVVLPRESPGGTRPEEGWFAAWVPGSRAGLELSSYLRCTPPAG